MVYILTPLYRRTLCAKGGGCLDDMTFQPPPDIREINAEPMQTVDFGQDAVTAWDLRVSP